ncbi:MAG: transposase [Armatimonadota bacterium]
MLHYITLNVREGKRPFARDLYARIVLQELRDHCDKHPAKLIAYGAMPTHLHAILNPRDGNIDHFLSQFKPGATIAVGRVAALHEHEAVLTWLSATPDGHQQLWQDGKYDFHLWSERLIWQKIDYIHNNAILAGLVTRASDYPYSSFAAWYGTGVEPIIPINKDFWWEDYTLEEMLNEDS